MAHLNILTITTTTIILLFLFYINFLKNLYLFKKQKNKLWRNK